MVRTRFAPSPTGYLHLGGVRTALFSWAYAKKMGGKCILRIEDTDTNRSNLASVQTILDGLSWLHLNFDEGPFYQSDRIARYQEVVKQLLREDKAYYCYCSKEELDAMRQAAQSKGERFIYDRRWRPEVDKTLPPIPQGIKPVVRFKMPIIGATSWKDEVKGKISFDNHQLDDLIIARADGSPTYNLCVVVDDYDMQITHVIRGDDHINNTPKQINILKALSATLPSYAHLPMILNASGHKMSKRKDAVSVMEYEQEGILPQALINYLARLGWSHGDDEIFSMDHFLHWFALKDINPSPSRFDMNKLLWLNGEYIKAASIASLSTLVVKILHKKGINQTTHPPLKEIVSLLKERSNNINDLAKETLFFYQRQIPNELEIKKYWHEESANILRELTQLFEKIPEKDWTRQHLQQMIQTFCEEKSIKLSQLGMPLRLQLLGTTKTPTIDALLATLGQSITLKRLKQDGLLSQSIK